MFRTVLVRSGNVVSQPNTRGLATLKDVQARLNPVKNIQSMKMVSEAKFSTTGKDLQKTRSIAEAIPVSLKDAAQKNFRKALQAAIVELRPPTPAEIPRAIKDAIRIFKGKNWKNLTVREAWLNALVTTEVICWFFVGECIGKGTFIGYQV